MLGVTLKLDKSEIILTELQDKNKRREITSLICHQSQGFNGHFLSAMQTLHSLSSKLSSQNQNVSQIR